ncbi:MAG: hypothetical protein ABFC38_02285 [Methanospirillum sp.]
MPLAGTVRNDLFNIDIQIGENILDRVKGQIESGEEIGLARLLDLIKIEVKREKEKRLKEKKARIFRILEKRKISENLDKQATDINDNNDVKKNGFFSTEKFEDKLLDLFKEVDESLFDSVMALIPVGSSARINDIGDMLDKIIKEKQAEKDKENKELIETYLNTYPVSIGLFNEIYSEEGSADKYPIIEKIAQFTEGWSKKSIRKFIIKLSEKRSISLDQMEEIANKFLQEIMVTPTMKENKRNLVRFIIKNNILIEDPAFDIIIKYLARETEGYVGADIESLCREAGMLALREKKITVECKHFKEALAKIRPTMNENSRNYYNRTQQHFKGGLPKEVQPPEYQ